MQYTALEVPWGNVNKAVDSFGGSIEERKHAVHSFGGSMEERKQCNTQLWGFHGGT